MTRVLGSPKRARPLRRDAATNRQRLIAAAQQVFGELGPDASVEEVARVAGLGMGTLYRRFPTKEALVSELVHELLSQLVADAEEALAHGDGDGLERFLTRAASDLVVQRGCLARMWGPHLAPELVGEVRRLIGELLRDAKRHGRVREEITASDISVLFWALRGVIETTAGVAPQAWRRHLAVVMAGLRPCPSPLPGHGLSRHELERIAG